MKESKITFDYIHLLCSLLGSAAGGLLGVALGATLTAYSMLKIGNLPGYEAGGVIGGALGLWLGALIGGKISSLLSHSSGNFLLSALLGLVGAGITLVGAAWMIPGINGMWMLLVPSLFATIGWHLPRWQSKKQ